MLMPPKTRDWRWFMFLSGISSLPEFTVIASHALLVGAAIHRLSALVFEMNRGDRQSPNSRARFTAAAGGESRTYAGGGK